MSYNGHDRTGPRLNYPPDGFDVAAVLMILAMLCWGAIALFTILEDVSAVAAPPPAPTWEVFAPPEGSPFTACAVATGDAPGFALGEVVCWTL